jgi:hypothetical protein
MRIVINIDAIRQGKKRMRIRTKFQRTDKDGRQHITVGNAMAMFYNDLVEMIREGIDPEITDFQNEGEKI